MPTYSRTEAANLALAKIRGRKLDDLDTDTTVEADQARLAFPLALDRLLSQHQWNFAKARAALVAGDPDPLGEWDYSYDLPANCVRPLVVIDTASGAPITRFAIEGRTLFCNVAAGVGLRYLANDTDILEWHVGFLEAFVLELAADLALAVAQNPQLAGELKGQAAVAMRKAILNDTQEADSGGENYGPADVIAQSPLVAARYGAHGSIIPPIYITEPAP